MGVPDKVLSDLEFRRYVYHRKRYGAAANFDAKANEATSLYVRLLTSGYLEGAHKHYLVINNLDDSSQGFARRCLPAFRTRAIRTASLPRRPSCSSRRPTRRSASRMTSRSSAATAYSRASASITTLPTQWAPTVSHRAPAASGPIRIRYPLPTTTTAIRLPDVSYAEWRQPGKPCQLRSAGDRSRPFLCEGRRMGDGDRRHIPTGSGDEQGEWKFGLSGRWRHKTYVSTSPVWTPNGVISLSPYTFGPPQFYYNHNYDIGPAIDFNSVADWWAPTSARSATMRRPTPRPTPTTTRTCMRLTASTRAASATRVAGRRASRVHARQLPRQSLQQRYRHEHARDRVELLHQCLPDRAGPLLLQRAARRPTYLCDRHRAPGLRADHARGVHQRRQCERHGRQPVAAAHHRPESRCHARVLPGQRSDRRSGAVRRSSSATTSCSRSSSFRATPSRD